MAESSNKDVIRVSAFTGEDCDDWESFLIGIFVSLKKAMKSPGVTLKDPADLSAWAANINRCLRIFKDEFERGQDYETIMDAIKLGYSRRESGITEAGVALGLTADRINSELYEVCISACSTNCAYLNSQAILNDGLSYLMLMRSVCMQTGMGAEHAARENLERLKFEGTADRTALRAFLVKLHLAFERLQSAQGGAKILLPRRIYTLAKALPMNWKQLISELERLAHVLPFGTTWQHIESQVLLYPTSLVAQAENFQDAKIAIAMQATEANVKSKVDSAMAAFHGNGRKGGSDKHFGLPKVPPRMCSFCKAEGAAEGDKAAFHWDRDCKRPAALKHFATRPPKHGNGPYHTASAMQSMIEQQEDDEERYDEAYLEHAESAHVAICGSSFVDDACFEPRAFPDRPLDDEVLISRPQANVAATALPSSVGVPSAEPVVHQTGQSQSGLTLVFFCVIICLTIPDKLQALAVSAFACLLAQDQAFALYQSVSSSVWSLVSSLPSVSSLWSSISSAVSHPRACKVGCATLCLLAFCFLAFSPELAYGQSEPVTPELALLASTPPLRGKHSTSPLPHSTCPVTYTFLCDSGCSSTICNQREALDAISGLRTPVLTGDKVITYSHGVGTMRAVANTNNGPTLLNIQCMYMPTFSSNLLSVTALRNQGCTVVFPPAGSASYIKLPNGSIITLREENKVYYLDLQSSSSADSSTMTSAMSVAMSAASTMAWHKRLGHLNFAAIKKMVKAGLLPGFSASEFVQTFCHDCPQAKLTMAKFPQQAMQRALFPLARVCSDIAGPFFNSLHTAVYYHVFVDEYSGKRWAYTMSNKNTDTLLRNFKQFFADVGTPKSLRLDRDAVFTCGLFRSLACDKQIRLEYCQPRRHAQNGLAERTVRSLNSMTRILLLSSKLPDHLWPFALQYAVWLQNRLPSRDTLLSKLCSVPITLFSGVVPNPAWFRVFGAVTYAINDAQHRAKLGPQAVRCRFLGYSTEVGKPRFVWLPLDVRSTLVSSSWILKVSLLHQTARSLMSRQFLGRLLSSQQLQSLSFLPPSTYHCCLIAPLVPSLIPFLVVRLVS